MSTARLFAVLLLLASSLVGAGFAWGWQAGSAHTLATMKIDGARAFLELHYVDMMRLIMPQAESQLKELEDN